LPYGRKAYFQLPVGKMMPERESPSNNKPMRSAAFWINALLLITLALVSFGHAAYLGLGAYAVGIPAYHALYGGMDAVASFNGFLHLGLAITVSALFALVTGAISLRTRGVNFIMITMAFGQMIFYAIVALENYGGDDGLTIDVRYCSFYHL